MRFLSGWKDDSSHAAMIFCRSFRMVDRVELAIPNRLVTSVLAPCLPNLLSTSFMIVKRSFKESDFCLDLLAIFRVECKILHMGAKNYFVLILTFKSNFTLSEFVLSGFHCTYIKLGLRLYIYIYIYIQTYIHTYKPD